ncbi:MAG TPA: hypothetical protein VMT24_04350 [Aggregatilineaceae bacterium]|nr:hypothetical protein [Aggregatilineaceae bacterium]
MDQFLRSVVSREADYARNRAAWEGASAVERATFGRIFNAVEGVIFLVMVFGCIAISSATANSRVLMYVVGFIWILLFIAVGVLLARFRHAVFVRVRGLISSFLGGPR